MTRKSDLPTAEDVKGILGPPSRPVSGEPEKITKAEMDAIENAAIAGKPLRATPPAAAGRDEPRALIDGRLADLRSANDVLRVMNWDKSSEIQRNDREIRWLLDLRSILALGPAVSPQKRGVHDVCPYPYCGAEMNGQLNCPSCGRERLCLCCAATTPAPGTDRAAVIEECAKIADDQTKGWVHGEAVTAIGQAYQRACRNTAAAIRALAPKGAA